MEKKNEKKLEQKREQKREQRRFMKRWQKIAVAMACLVAVVTLGVLTLPAITMNQYQCGIDEHAHTESCYTTSSVTADAGHIHSDDCYAWEQVLVCDEEESEGHIHDESCYDPESGELICNEEESEGHIHDESCYELQRGELICGQMEGEQVIEEETVLTCELEEHIHDENCLQEDVAMMPEEDTDPLLRAGDGSSDSGFGISWMIERSSGTNELSGTNNSELSHTPANRNALPDNMTLAQAGMTDTYSSVLANISFREGSEGSSEHHTFEAGELEFRVPYKIITDREGNYTGKTFLAIPQKGQEPADSAYSFSYEIDEENNEIIIRNYKTIEGSAVGADIEVRYVYDPYEVEDGYTNNTIAATIIKGDETPETSEPLSLSIDTDFPQPSVSKYVERRYPGWRTFWTGEEEPEEYAGGEAYIVWKVRIRSNGTATQPFTMNIDEHLPEGAEIVAYYEAGKNMADVANYYKRTTTAEFIAKTDWRMFTDKNIKTNEEDIYLVVRYPEEYFKNTTVTNQVDITFTGDNNVQKTAQSQTATAEYRFEDTPNGSMLNTDKINAYVGSDEYENTIHDSGIAIVSGGQTITTRFYIDNIIARSSYETDTANNTVTIDPITQVIEDHTVYLGGTLLEKGDYYFTEINPRINQFTRAVMTNGVVETVTGGSWYNYSPEISWQYKLAGDTQWRTGGTISNSDLSSNIDSTVVTMPEGAVDFRVVYPNSELYSSTLRVTATLQLNPTEHVKQILANYRGGEISLTNIESSYFLDEDGKIISLDTDYEGTDEMKQQLYEQDQEEYAQYGIGETGATPDKGAVGHDSAVVTLTDLTATSETTKRGNLGSTTEQTNEAANGRIRMHYTINQFEYTKYVSSVAPEQLIAGNVLNTHDQAVIYDLLPAHVTVDLSTLTVTNYLASRDGQTYYNADHSATTLAEVRSSGVQGSSGASSDLNLVNKSYEITDIQFIENWRGSGRTMMIVSVDYPEGEQNCIRTTRILSNRITSDLYYSGVQLKYDTLMYFEDMPNGSFTMRNSVAYHSLDGDLTDGEPQNGGDLTDKEFFENFTGDLTQPVDETEKDTVYAESVNSYLPTIASEYVMAKAVKSAEDSEYMTSTSVKAGSTYSYRLRYGTSTGSSGVYIFDALEYGNAGVDYWRGKLQAIDVSQFTARGIDAKVYVTTSADYTDGSRPTSLDDLTEANGWYPGDTEEDIAAVSGNITGILIDLSKARNGTDYTFPAGSKANAYVYMTAPDEYKTTRAFNNFYAREGTGWTQTSTVNVRMRPEASLKINLTKELQYKNLNAGEFTFTLKEVTGYDTGSPTETLISSVRNRSGRPNEGVEDSYYSETSFPDLSYTTEQTGRYVYVIAETRGANTNMIYDETLYYIMVDVELDDNGVPTPKIVRGPVSSLEELNAAQDIEVSLQKDTVDTGEIVFRNKWNRYSYVRIRKVGADKIDESLTNINEWNDYDFSGIEDSTDYGLGRAYFYLYQCSDPTHDEEDPAHKLEKPGACMTQVGGSISSNTNNATLGQLTLGGRPGTYYLYESSVSSSSGYSPVSGGWLLKMGYEADGLTQKYSLTPLREDMPKMVELSTGSGTRLVIPNFQSPEATRAYVNVKKVIVDGNGRIMTDAQLGSLTDESFRMYGRSSSTGNVGSIWYYPESGSSTNYAEVTPNDIVTYSTSISGSGISANAYIQEQTGSVDGVTYDTTRYYFTIVAYVDTEGALKYRLAKYSDFNSTLPEGGKDAEFDAEGNILIKNQIQTFDFDFTKVDSSDHTVGLDNVEFTLYGCSDDSHQDLDSHTDECWVEMGDAVSEDGGKVKFSGLTKGGYYKLVETQSVQAYKTPTGYWILNLVNPEDTDGTGNPLQEVVSEWKSFGENPELIVNNEKTELLVPNDGATELPETGGIGTHLYRISGMALLMGCALIYGYTRRKKRKEAI